jgi:hypothetical protein
MRGETAMFNVGNSLIDRPWIQVRHVPTFEGEFPIQGVS